MSKITKHTDRPEFNTEEQRQLEEKSRLRLRNYTKKVLSHHYLKAKKQASDEISRLISRWKFDVPGWTGDSAVCPVFHKTQEDLELEQDMERKKEALLGRRDGTKMSKFELQNEELIEKYDKSTPLPPAPKKSNEEKVRDNAFSIMSQFFGTEAAKPMMEAYESKDYHEVFELALRNDLRNRRFQSMERSLKKEALEQGLVEIQNKLSWNPKIIWSELMDEVVKEHNGFAEPDPHATGHCSEAIKHLSGDLNYDDRALARDEMLQCLKSLKAYPQSTAPAPKSRFDECTCIACTNTKALSEVLKDIVHSPSGLSETEKEEIDNLFLTGKDDISDEKIRDFGTKVVSFRPKA